MIQGMVTHLARHNMDSTEDLSETIMQSQPLMHGVGKHSYLLGYSLPFLRELKGKAHCR